MEIRNPVMFVVGRQRADHVHLSSRPIAHPSTSSPGRITVWLCSDGDLRQLRRGHGRGPRQGPGRHAAPDARRRPRPGVLSADGAEELVPAAELPRATWWSARPGELIPSTATSSRASPRSTSRPSPASRPRSSASPAATARRSPAAPRCCPTGSWCGSPPSRGQTFLDRMIALVEGANRQKTPNEIALTILLAVLTIIFLPVVVSLQPFGHYSGAQQSVVVLVALLVCLIPTTIGALLSAIGIAGMDRLVQRNVLAMAAGPSRRPATCRRCCWTRPAPSPSGNRRASDFLPVPAGTASRSWPTRPSWRRWPTRRPRAVPSWCSPRSGSTSASASSRPRRRVRAVHRPDPHGGPRRRTAARSARARPTRSSQWVEAQGGTVPGRPGRRSWSGSPAPGRHAAGGGRRPRASSGVIDLKDIVKQGIEEKFAEMREMGIRTVMITGDNPLTAAAIAARGRGRRLPGRGHPRGQDGPDQGRAGRAASWWP